MREKTTTEEVHCYNEATIRQMVEQQKGMRVPTELVPHCPLCGKPMTMNLRCDDTFVQDEGWYSASERYTDFPFRIILHYLPSLSLQI